MSIEWAKNWGPYEFSGRKIMSDRAKELLKNSIVVDGLFHSLLDDPPPTDGKKDVVDLILEGGVNVINASVILDYYKNDFAAYVKALYRFFMLQEAFPEKVLLIRSYADILQAKKEHKLALILSMQGADAIEHDLRYITMLHKLGVRLIQITYNQRNNLGCGVFEPQDSGLTRFGQQSIFEMNRLGIVVDLSHVGLKTSLDAIEISRDPVIFSHCSVGALCEHPRNLSDEQIRSAAAKGGVVGVCPHSVMCMKSKGSRPTVNDFIDHIEYIVNLAGDDHVGIGTDRWMRPTQAYKLLRVEFERTLPGFFGSFSGEEKHVEGFNYYDEWENLADSLIKRGFSNLQIQKILGGNFCRVFQKVWGQN